MTVPAQPATQATSDGPTLLVEDHGPVRHLILNRPAQYNALSEATLDALLAALDDLAADEAASETVRVVVLAGRGPAFSAGHDLKEMRAAPQPTQATYEALFRKSSRVTLGLTRLAQPVIARVHGIAAAAGCQLVGACDLAVASTEARFGTLGINIGLFCMTPGVAVARNTGRKKAFEMLFTGETISADEALTAGLVNRVVAPEDLDGEVARLADSIIGKSAAAVAAGKRFFYRQQSMDMDAAYAYAAEEMARNMTFEDAAEGFDAFIAKRPPKWRHR